MLEAGEIALLENTRFESGEAINDPDLAEFWASLGDLYVTTLLVARIVLTHLQLGCHRYASKVEMPSRGS